MQNLDYEPPPPPVVIPGQAPDRTPPSIILKGDSLMTLTIYSEFIVGCLNRTTAVVA